MYVSDDPDDDAHMVSPRTAVLLPDGREPKDPFNIVKTAVSVAKHLSDEGRNALLVIDSSSLLRFTPAFNLVSELLGRIPSAVSAQSPLYDEMGKLQERITSTKQGSITSMFSLPMAWTKQGMVNSSEFDSQLIMSPDIASSGSYPAIDLLQSSSKSLHPNVVGEEHYDIACCVQKLLVQEQLLKDDMEVVGEGAFSEEDKQTLDRARKAKAYFGQFKQDPLFEILNLHVRLKDTIRVCKSILNGDFDHVPEKAFNGVGTIEEVMAKAGPLLRPL